jgi:enamine deaminase RidA (YjgF/YER057c/UK114 family)
MIERKHVGARMSKTVIHNGTIYLCGQVSKGDSVAVQTQGCLDQIDALLIEAESDRNHILQATIWLADMANFAEMNAVWDAWVPADHAPTRACGGSPLATPEFLVEIIITAAVKD